MPKRKFFLTSDGGRSRTGPPAAAARGFGFGPEHAVERREDQPEAAPEDHEDDRRQVGADHVSDL